MDFKSEEFGRFFSAISLAMFFLFIVLICLSIVNYKPKKPLSNALVYGCYKADSAPAILLNKDGLTILQNDFLRLDYKLIQIKSVYMLEVYDPIEAFWDGRRFHFSITARGSGRYFPFYTIENNKLQYDYDPANLQNLHLSVRDGKEANYISISYIRTADSDCVFP